MRKTIRSAVAQGVAREAKAAGVSQAKLATVLGLSQPAMSRRASGEVDYRAEELAKIAAFLEIPLERLLSSEAVA